MAGKVTIETIIAPFQMQAMVQMGLIKIPNMDTEVDMNAARTAIDIIEFMEEKMKGNLNDEESKLIKEVLSTLQLTYVEMQKKGNNEGNNDKKEEQ